MQETERRTETQRVGRRRWRTFRTNLPLLIHRPLTFIAAYKWGLLVLLVGSVLDAVTTYANVHPFGPRSELHPAARILWEIVGVSPFTVALSKTVQALCAVFAAAVFRRWCPWILWTAGVLYALAAVNNHWRLL
jgi:membrane-bound metal-dependent hydrolase YbcI (DUF457 family)